MAHPALAPSRKLAAARSARLMGADAMVASDRPRARIRPRSPASSPRSAWRSARSAGSSVPSMRPPRYSGKRARPMANRTIRVDYIARVEGESSLDLRIRNGKVDNVRLSIFEPPRFFEALLRGRGFGEVLDIVARICGICPIAYQMSGVHAIEDALGITVDAPIRALRRLFYCGEWIQSHSLHIVMLHAPDFLGYPDAIAMARDHGEAVERALALKKTGNDLLRLLGGREIHPINARVGGFYRVPSRAELDPMAESLKHARGQAIGTRGRANAHWAGPGPGHAV